MDYGRFFMVHPKADVTRKPVLFFYLPLRGAKGSRFPIYLAFYQNKINFYFDGQLKFKVENKSEDGKNEEYSISESDLILSLDLTPDPVSQERLNSLLADAYSRTFPIADVMIDSKKINSPSGLMFEGIKTYKELDVFKDSEDKKLSKNFKLPSFFSNKKEKKINENTSPEDNKDNNSIKISYKDLILDFLFEASRENSVFSTCKQFTHIKSLMNQSFFLTALMRKAEFYYLVENYKIGNPGYSFNGDKDIYKKKLIRAQDLWLNSLHQSDSHKVINGNHWFKDIERETKMVFENIKKKNIHKGDSAYTKALLKHQKNSVKWTLYRTAIFKAWSLLLTFISIGVSSVFDNIKNIFKKKFALKITISLLALLVLFIIVFLVSKNIFVVLSILAIIYFVITLLFASIFRVLDILLLRLLFLVAGATYFAFEIARQFNYYLVKNNWTTFRLNLHSKPNGWLILFSAVILIVSYFILLDNEKKNHPNLSSRVSIRKVFVLMIFILSFSSLFNVSWMNNFHFRKELFEDNLLISEIWNKSLGDKNQIESENEHDDLQFYFKKTINNGRDMAPEKTLKRLVVNMENPRYNSEREHMFNKYLTHIVVKDKQGKELYPLVKEHDVFGYKIYIVPPVLYFNIFLTLFLVVFFQVIIHHKKVIEGGHFE